MAVVDLELFKKHVRADDFDDDDAYLLHLLDTAEQHVVDMTCRSAVELAEANGGYFPGRLKQAIMLLAAHWYNQRETASSTQMHEVPYALQALVKPFIRLVP